MKGVPSWDDLRFFLAVAETGSLSAASRRLHTNQPTVGRRIAALEAALGARLFQRHSRGLSLTETGGRILQSVASMEEAAAAVARSVLGEDSSLTGSVRVSAPEGLSAALLGPRIGQLQAKFPGIEIVLQATATAADLPRGEADVALRLFRPQAADLVARRVGTMEFGFYVAADYAAGRPPLDSLADLKLHPVIGYEEEFAHPPTSAWFAEQSRGAKVMLRCNSVLVRAAAAASGSGVTILPRLVGDPWPGLVPVLTAVKPPKREIWLVVHRDLQYVARIRVVLDFLGALFQAESQAQPTPAF